MVTKNQQKGYINVMKYHNNIPKSIKTVRNFRVKVLEHKEVRVVTKLHNRRPEVAVVANVLQRAVPVAGKRQQYRQYLKRTIFFQYAP